MGFDDIKLHGAQRYSGMRVGGRHEWDYTDGRWSETKIAPDQWDFSFRSTKRRRRHAPPGSGAPEGTGYHWLVLAHQRVRKLDEDTYATFMEGSKWKVAHKRPQWGRWSSEYPQARRARQRVVDILEETAAGLRAQVDGGAPRLENALDPRVLKDASLRVLEEWASKDEGSRMKDEG
jgi:hypothetical protein